MRQRGIKVLPKEPKTPGDSAGTRTWITWSWVQYTNHCTTALPISECLPNNTFMTEWVSYTISQAFSYKDCCHIIGNVIHQKSQTGTELFIYLSIRSSYLTSQCRQQVNIPVNTKVPLRNALNEQKSAQRSPALLFKKKTGWSKNTMYPPLWMWPCHCATNCDYHIDKKENNKFKWNGMELIVLHWLPFFLGLYM